MSAPVLTSQPELNIHKPDYIHSTICDPLAVGCKIGSTYDSASYGLLLELLNLYTMRSYGDKLDTTAMATSGGYQQYLIRRQLEGNDAYELQPRKGFGSITTTIHDLPDSIQLQIFSYLSSKELCKVCSVCTHWAVISTDNLLWQRRLKIDSMKWNSISNTTNPDLFKQCDSDLQSKDIYMRCSPEVCAFMKKQNVTFHSFSQYIRSFLPKRIPRIAMFGPGMETSTSGIVRKILDDKSGLFTTTGMFPGRVRGLGSGFTIKVQDSFTMNFIPLYSNTKEERENRTRERRLQGSRFFQNQNSQNGPAAQEESTNNLTDIVPITTDMKDLLRGVDGFVFVADASMSEKEGVDMARCELFSMINDQWCTPTAPLVVLSCTPVLQTPRVPNMTLVRQLDLSRFNRPWQIHTAVVGGLEGCVPVLEWLIETCQRR